MNIFTKKSFIQKIAIVCIFLTLFNFIASTPVRADNSSIPGGKLINPIMNLIVGVGDGIMGIIQSALLDMDESYIQLQTKADWWEKALIVLGAVLIVGVCIAAAIVPGAGPLAITLAVGKVLLTTGLTTAAIATAAWIGTDYIGNDEFYLTFYQVTPYEIFSNKLGALDINFFNPKNVLPYTYTDENLVLPDKERTLYYEDINGNNAYDKDTDKVVGQSSAVELQNTIASWYYTLRNFAIIVMLSILVYIGIRMLLSSIASDKAKYKKMIVDWLVSFCLLFMLQYIMVFAVSLNTKLIDIVDNIQSSGTATTEGGVTKEYTKEGVAVYFIQKDGNEKLVKEAFNNLHSKGKGNGSCDYMFIDSSGSSSGVNSIDDVKEFMVIADNFMQQARVECQLEGKSLMVSAGWKIIYVILVIYTVIFLFTYLKRVVYMAFLTIIAPLVAMTYAIDKMHDGQAQAFNMWLKEYIFNLLIQPVHLLLYFILIGSAMDFVADNIIYVCVALGFMIPAEKLLRKFFGFEKASTPGMLAGAGGAALMMSGIQKLRGLGQKGGHNGGGGSSSSKDDSKIRLAGSADSSSVYEDAQNRLNGGTPSGDTGTPPGDTGTPPGDTGTPPRDTGTPPGDTGTPLGDTGTPPGDTGTPPGDTRTPSEDTGTSQGEEKPTWEQYALDEAKRRWNESSAKRGIDNFKAGAREKLNNTKDKISGINDKYKNSKFSQRIEKGKAKRAEERAEKAREKAEKAREKAERINNRPWSGSSTGRALAKGGKKMKLKLAKAGSGVSSYARGKWNGFKKNYRRKLDQKKPLRSLIRGTAGVASGALLGTAGLMAGIASGDMGKAAQYVGAGAGVGYAVGKAGANRIMEDIPSGNGVEDFEKGYYGADYDKVQRQRDIDKFSRDEDNISYFEQHLKEKDASTGEIRDISRKQAKELLKDKLTQRCINEGITDIKDIATVQQRVKDGENEDDAVFGAKCSNEFGGDYNKDVDKNEKILKKRIENKYGETNPNNKNMLEEMKKHILDHEEKRNVLTNYDKN